MPRQCHGGGDNCIIVDTLNLTYYLYETVGLEHIIGAIQKTAPILTAKYKGRVMFVLKDRETEFDDAETRKKLLETAQATKVYIYCAQKYKVMPKSANKATNEHSAMGRDDFLMLMLARRWRCPIATNDRLRDINRFTKTLQPFYFCEMSPWSNRIITDYIAPEYVQKVFKPRKIELNAFFK